MRLNREPKLIKRTVWNVLKVFQDERHQRVTTRSTRSAAEERMVFFPLSSGLKTQAGVLIKDTVPISCVSWANPVDLGNFSLKLGFRPDLLDLCPILWHQEAHFAAAAAETRGSPIQVSIRLMLAAPDWTAFGENEQLIKTVIPHLFSQNFKCCWTWVSSPSSEQFKRQITSFNTTQMLAKLDHPVFSCVLSPFTPLFCILLPLNPNWKQWKLETPYSIYLNNFKCSGWFVD